MRILFVSIVLFVVTSCNSTNSVGLWKSVVALDKSEPVERHEAAFVGVGKKLVLLGGRGIRPVSIYNTETKNWKNGSKPPIELHHFQPVIYQSKIYIVGALTGGWPNETPVPNIYIYHPNSDKWEVGPEIPSDRRRGAAGVVIYNDKLYLSCGIKNGHIGDHKKWLDSYDFKTGNWEKLADAPRERDHFHAVVAHDKLYLAAGRLTTTGDNNFGNTIGEVDVYDLKSKQWKTLPNNLPTLRAGNTAVLFQNEILVIGGESDSQEMAHDDVEALQLKKETWRKLAPMKEGRHGTSAILFDQKLYLASGCGKRGGEPELKSMECFSN